MVPLILNFAENLVQSVGASVGGDVGDAVGFDVGVAVGVDVGDSVGFDVGDSVGVAVGDAIGVDVGDSVGGAVGVGVGRVSTREHSAGTGSTKLEDQLPYPKLGLSGLVLSIKSSRKDQSIMKRQPLLSRP